MCQHSTKISGRLNIMLISTTIQLHCNWLSWMQVQQRGWCSRDPTYTTKQKWHFQILTYYKTAKISTQGVSKIPCSGAEPPLRPAHLHLDTHEEFYEFWLPSTPENSKMRHFLWNYYHLEKILYNERSILKNRRAYLKKKNRRQDNKCSSQTIPLLYSTIFGMRTYLQRKETAD